jgi:hypothetical protein
VFGKHRTKLLKEENILYVSFDIQRFSKNEIVYDNRIRQSFSIHNCDWIGFEKFQQGDGLLAQFGFGESFYLSVCEFAQTIHHNLVAKMQQGLYTPLDMFLQGDAHSRFNDFGIYRCA